MIEVHSRRYVGLDGLRGIAAFTVVLLHGTLIIDSVGYVPRAACLAVDFFFLLSGFVIAHAYDARLLVAMTWPQFMLARIIRLYPMLFVGTALGGIFFILSQTQKHDFPTIELVAVTIGAFGLLPTGLALGTVAYPVNIAVWSLFFEFVVNGLYGTRFGRLSNRALGGFVVIAAIALVPLALWGGPWIEIGFSSPPTFLLGLVRVTYPFWAGVLLFRIWQANKIRVGSSTPILLLGFILAGLLLAPVNNPIYNLVLIILAFPLIVGVAANATVGSRMSKVCSIMGRLSYPLYIVHVPLIRATNRIAETLHLTISPWVWVVVAIIMSVLVAEILLVWLDEPVRKWLGQAHRRYDPVIASR